MVGLGNRAGIAALNDHMSATLVCDVVADSWRWLVVSPFSAPMFRMPLGSFVPEPVRNFPESSTSRASMISRTAPPGYGPNPETPHGKKARMRSRAAA